MAWTSMPAVPCRTIPPPRPTTLGRYADHDPTPKLTIRESACATTGVGS
jgi:hypothetical protein